MKAATDSQEPHYKSRALFHTSVDHIAQHGARCAARHSLLRFCTVACINDCNETKIRHPWQGRWAESRRMQEARGVSICGLLTQFGRKKLHNHSVLRLEIAGAQQRTKDDL
eukprot:1719197-Amphidinium_carterae.1